MKDYDTKITIDGITQYIKKESDGMFGIYSQKGTRIGFSNDLDEAVASVQRCLNDKDFVDRNYQTLIN